MAIVRGPRPTDHFAQIHNSALADGRLSFKARGLLAYLLSRPEGWRTSAEALARDGRDGRDAIRSGLRELEQHGYLQRTRMHNPETGTWAHEQVVTDQPDVDNVDTIGGFSVDGLPAVGEAADSSKKDTPKKETTSVDGGVGTEVQSDVGHTGTGWKPSPAALATAHEQTTITDIPLHITRYRVVCAERQKQPSSSEWLKWLIEDERKARAEERQRERDQRQSRSWYSVAD